jgi:DUF4097 and DUF4098 domain-containing protein YvlB
MILHILLLALHHPVADTTLRLPRNGAVEIDTHMRDVNLRVGAGDMVIIKGARGELDGGTISIGDDMRHSARPGGAIDIVVPAWAHVEIGTIGGNLTFTGTPDRLQATTVNGFIHVNGGGGTLELETVAGNIVINDFRGTALNIDATGGTIAISNATGNIAVENVNGGISLKGIRSSALSANTVNGAIDFEGTFAPGGHYDFGSQNDNITFTLAADVSARMTVTTMNGQLISPQIPATTRGMVDNASRDKGDKGGKGSKGNKDKEFDERTFTVTYGSGAARVTVDMFNGDLIVKKKM